MFKLIIAGGRKYKFKQKDEKALASLLTQLGGRKNVEIVTGGAAGADTAGYLWALDNAVPRSAIFHAEWRKNLHLVRPECLTSNEYGQYNRCAGPERNARMAAYADGVVLFPGGDGTEDMYKAAYNHVPRLKIWDWRKGVPDGT